MKILFASSEVYPYSKTGGLADVVGALPEALVKLGHQVLVVSPWYKTLKAKEPPLWIGDEWIPFDGGISICGVGTLEKNGVNYAFVSHEFFQRNSIYGFADDVKRFCLFTRAIPQVAAKMGFQPDIFHANDWHTGYLPMVLEHGWHLPEGFPKTPSVFTIHNAQYQGNSSLEETLYWLRLPTSLKDSHMNYFGSANAMQAALGFADKVTTVSPTYAEEIKLVEYAYGLDGSFRHISNKLVGILNGIDVEQWNPSTDPYIAERYDQDSLSQKASNKHALCERFSLDATKPLLGVVSRLVDQKGIDFMLESIPGLLWQGWNVVILGAGEGQMEDTVHYHANTNPGRVAAFIGYDESLAHLIYAGVDALVIPSRFEPCGLTQMIAMRYGTLPIARDTGGLHDSILHDQTGFLFDAANPEGVLWACGVAKGVYDQPKLWKERQVLAMQQDFSWERSAKAYEALYQDVIEKKITFMLEDAFWQQPLNQGQAEEAYKLSQQSGADSATQDFLESLVTLQSLLREKNIPQAQKLLTKPDLPEWTHSLLAELTPQLANLEKAHRHLDKHEPEKILSVLTSVHHPLLLGEAETLRGTALIYQNDTAGARAAFENVLSYDAKHYRAITNLGNLALESNQLEEAVLYYEKALKINEHFANAHHNLAVAYKRKGEVGKSVHALKQAQRASQQKMKEEARGMLKSPRATKYLRWIFFAGLAVVVYFALKAR